MYIDKFYFLFGLKFFFFWSNIASILSIIGEYMEISGSWVSGSSSSDLSPTKSSLYEPIQIHPSMQIHPRQYTIFLFFKIDVYLEKKTILYYSNFILFNHFIWKNRYIKKIRKFRKKCLKSYFSNWHGSNYFFMI